ncbi:MAG: adenylate/guanylate cyclase domain-containing protein [Alphaproteobacteria bacterium]|nr:adenylate/guanylate cyclase domain-containing protein [Alphaproteobacteria bacterium]
MRRLEAILVADVAGYSRLMGVNEEGTLAALKAIRREVGDPKVKAHRGRIVKTIGDGLLIEFASVVDAVRCAVEVQREMAERNADVPPDRRIEFRIGINVGDIIKDGRDIYGDGVNVAARLEALAEPGGICVSRVVRDQVRDKLAFSFEDMGEQRVKNIARPVHVHRIVLGERPASPEPAKGASTKSALALPDKPSIAVLAFQNMSGDPEQEYFADGMVEEIITALSRVRWLFVIARNSSFTYKGQAIDVKQVGRELGVRYVLEGSVRKAGGRLRIAAQLIDAISGTHIWADRFDGSLKDVFELQDQVASSVVGAIEPALQAVETARSASRPTNDLTAYDLYLRAWHNVLSYEKGRIDQALDLLERAAARDPGYGPALALAAYCHQQLQISGWAEDHEANRRTAIDLARRAVQVATDDPAVLGRAALVLGYFGEDIDAALALIDRALALNPSSARAWYWSGILRLYAGRLGLSIEHFNSSLRLSPRDPTPTRGRSLAGIGIAQFLDQRYEEAAATLLASLQELPTYAPTYRFLASCYAHMGRLEEAREIVERLRAFTTGVLEGFSPLRNSGHRELFLSGLRLAMGETT